jgi:hypothetical protein
VCGERNKKKSKKKIGEFFFIFILAVSTEQSIHPTTMTTPHPVPSPPTTLDDDPVGVNDCPNRTTKKEFRVSFLFSVCQYILTHNHDHHHPIHPLSHPLTTPCPDAMPCPPQTTAEDTLIGIFPKFGVCGGGGLEGD